MAGRSDRLGKRRRRRRRVIERVKAGGHHVRAGPQHRLDLGLAGPYRTRAEMDELYGRGRWRPVPRHIVYQDKPRPIDDSRRGLHHTGFVLQGTIVCLSGEFIPLAAKVFLSWVASLMAACGMPADSPLEMLRSAPDWFVLVSALEDLWKGYRQNHARARDRGLCVATFVHPVTRKRVYSEMYGLPFGFAVVVFHFNRSPMVFIAFLRRAECAIAGHYVDDNIKLALTRHAGWAKTLHVRTFRLFGALVSHDKRTPFRSLGTSRGTLATSL